MASPPACTSSSGTLSAPADFPFLDDCTAASTYSSLSVAGGTFSTSAWVSCGSVVVQLGAVLGPPL